MLGKVGGKFQRGLRMPLTRRFTRISVGKTTDSFPTEPTAVEMLSLYDSQEFGEDSQFISSATDKVTGESDIERLGLIRTDSFVYEAAKLMDQLSQGTVGDPCTALIVQDEKETKGIFSERDLTKTIAKTGGNVSTVKVGEVMTSSEKWKGTWVTPRTSLSVCKEIIKKFHIRHLPVFGEKRDKARDMETLHKELVPKKGSVFHGIITLKQVLLSTANYQLAVDTYQDAIDEKRTATHSY